MSSEDAVRGLYAANETAREWPASKVAEKLSLSEEQVALTGEFRRNRARADEQNLLPDDYEILAFAAAAGRPVRGTEVGPRLGRPRPTVRKKLDALVAAGYLTRVSGNHGGYALTDEGRRALADRRDASRRPDA